MKKRMREKDGKKLKACKKVYLIIFTFVLYFLQNILNTLQTTFSTTLINEKKELLNCNLEIPFDFFGRKVHCTLVFYCTLLNLIVYYIKNHSHLSIFEYIVFLFTWQSILQHFVVVYINTNIIHATTTTTVIQK